MHIPVYHISMLCKLSFCFVQMKMLRGATVGVVAMAPVFGCCVHAEGLTGKVKVKDVSSFKSSLNLLITSPNMLYLALL